MKRRLNDIYVHHTGQSYETIEKTLDRDYFLSAEEPQPSASSIGHDQRQPLDAKVQELTLVSSRATLSSASFGSARPGELARRTS